MARTAAASAKASTVSAAPAQRPIAQPAEPSLTLRRSLAKLRTEEARYWDFSLRTFPEHSPVYLQYPAMMIPEMQGKLLDMVREVDPAIRTVMDPFLGSGVILSEAQVRGLNFIGQDINPLAVLLCQVKANPPSKTALKTAETAVARRLGRSRSTAPATRFPGQTKWFTPTAIAQFSQIRRAIQREPDLRVRQFLWICMAETIRLCSNSRTTTYKLHIRPPAERQGRRSKAIATFLQILKENLTAHAKAQAALRRNRPRGAVPPRIRVAHGDSAVRITGHAKADLVVTSPPYGDNHTTVPYGQFSYLALCWIPKKDLPHPDADLWSNTHRLDSKSLGGTRILEPSAQEQLQDASPVLKQFLAALEGEPRDRRIRVLSFARDLRRTIQPILSKTRPGGWMIWTVGNRRVGGRRVPLDGMLRDFLQEEGVDHVADFVRRIPSKRMASRNNVSGTILEETVLIMRRPIRQETPA